jgi:hypothetical protein
VGACKRKAFTIVELAIGITLMLIISVPVYMTLKTGVDLYLKTEANAVVTNGVRFTMDSFSRRISPMLNETTEIEVLQDPEIPETVPKYMNYVYLSGDSVVYRDSSGDHLLEGSEHITGISFTLPRSADESPDNFILRMSVTGSYKTAKLNIDAKETLYNTPVKDGNNIAGDNYEGNVIFFKTPGINEMSVSLDLYDNDTKIKINNSTMPKGTVILASYDLNITRDDIVVSYTDISSLDWYISGTNGSQRETSTTDPDNTTKNQYQYQLVDNDNNPITAKTFDTKGYGASGDFYIRTGTSTKTKWIDGGYGVIRCRLIPGAITSRGKTLTGTPVWSGYVEIKNKTFWETWLDAISGVPTEGFYNTNLGELEKFVTLEVNTEAEQLEMGVLKANKIKAASGAFTVARLDYKYMDNDRLYSIWENRTDKTSDTIPSIMTVTNYSVLINMKMNDVVLFGVTLSDTPNTYGGVVGSGIAFNDLGYGSILCAVDESYKALPGVTGYKQGMFVHPHDGSSTSSYGQKNFYLKGITNVSKANSTDGDCYNPAHVQNSSFTYDSESWWPGNHRILYSVIEYYYADDTYRLPHYIIRVRYLKPLSDSSVKDRLNEIKLKDPWYIGPEFYASEPMWFGEFVGNSTHSDKRTVDVRRYASTAETTVTAAADITADVNSKQFYGLNYSGTVKDIFKAKDLYLNNDATLATGASDRLKIADRDRYIGMQVYTDKETAAVDIYDISIVPGFTADEIRSILPANAKLYEISETVPSNRMPTAAMAWYGPGSPARNYNDAVFGTAGMSDGSGNNGSRYNSVGAGIIGLQHVPSSCTCPLENEIFKWLDK